MGSSVEEITAPGPQPDAEPSAPSAEMAPTGAELELAHAVSRALSGGASEDAVATALVEGGCPVGGARAIVLGARASGAEPIAAPRAAGTPDTELADRYARRILYGFLWAAGGVVVTVVSYGSSSGGGRYVVAYGAILYGVLAMMSGAAGWAKHR